MFCPVFADLLKVNTGNIHCFPEGFLAILADVTVSQLPMTLNLISKAQSRLRLGGRNWWNVRHGMAVIAGDKLIL